MSDIVPPRTTHRSGAKLPAGWSWVTDLCDFDGYRDELQDASGNCLALIWWEPDGWRWGWPDKDIPEQRPSSLAGARRKAAAAAIARRDK